VVAVGVEDEGMVAALPGAVARLEHGVLGGEAGRLLAPAAARRNTATMPASARVGRQQMHGHPDRDAPDSERRRAARPWSSARSDELPSRGSLGRFRGAA
jgi:hypothetical protein